MKKIILIIAIAILLGCDSRPNQGREKAVIIGLENNPDKFGNSNHVMYYQFSDGTTDEDILRGRDFYTYKVGDTVIMRKR